MGKILVVEGSLIVNQHIRKILESGQHEVLSAFSKKEVISLVSSETPDLVLMDIDSYEIHATLEIKEIMDLPIIFLTASTEEDMLIKARINQPYGYVVKPFDEAELLSHIDTTLYRIEAEQAIKENSELFHTIINFVDYAIIIVDGRFNVKYSNTVVEKIFACSFRDLIHNSLDDYLWIKMNGAYIPVSEALTKYKMPKEFEIKNSSLIFGDGGIKEIFLREHCKFIFFRNISERVENRKMREELRTESVSILTEGQENERERIARDLHDGIGQLANVIKMTAKKLEVGVELNNLIDLFWDELRRVMQGLMPLQLDDCSLDLCLRELVDQINNISPIAFSFYSSDVPEVPMKVKINVYRVTQEAISNILKHSEAKHASVQLNGFDSHLQLSIEDDGKGFVNINDKEKNQTSRQGLQNIHFRSEVIGAICHIESSVNKGTFISLKIPMTYEKD